MHDGTHPAARQLHPGVHVGPQGPVGIVQAQANPQRPADRIEFRVDIVHHRFQGGVGPVLEPHSGGEAGLDPVDLPFQDLGDHPHGVEVGHGQHFRRRGDEDALADPEVGDDAVPRRRVGHTLQDRALPVETLDGCGVHAESRQAFPGRGTQGRVATGAGGEILLLGVHQGGRIQLEQALAGLHRVARGVHRQGFDPAVDTGVHVLDRLLVVGHVADRVDVSRQGAPLGGGGAHAQVGDHGRVDGYRALVGLPVRIHGHQVHAHG